MQTYTLDFAYSSACFYFWPAVLLLAEQKVFLMWTNHVESFQLSIPAPDGDPVKGLIS